MNKVEMLNQLESLEHSIRELRWKISGVEENTMEITLPRAKDESHVNIDAVSSYPLVLFNVNSDMFKPGFDNKFYNIVSGKTASGYNVGLSYINAHSFIADLQDMKVMQTMIDEMPLMHCALTDMVYNDKEVKFKLSNQVDPNHHKFRPGILLASLRENEELFCSQVEQWFIEQLK